MINQQYLHDVISNQSVDVVLSYWVSVIFIDKHSVCMVCVCVCMCVRMMLGVYIYVK